MHKQTAKDFSSSLKNSSKRLKTLSPNLPKELSTLLQIDLLLGRTQDFNNRLSQALGDLADMTSDSERAIKH